MTLLRRAFLAHPAARLALTALVLLTAACGPRETAVDRATREGIMIVGNGTEPQDLDPQTITGIPERNIVGCLFEGLTRLDPATLEPRPAAARSWTISDDGRLYTFHLRPGLTWSDGTPLNAHDFYASFRRMLAPTLASDNADQMYVVVNAEAYHKGHLQDFSQVGFRVPDDLTLEIHLINPTPYFTKLLGYRTWYPVPLHVIEKFGDPFHPGSDWTRPGNLVGNGPFILKSWQPNRFVELARNPAYWDPARIRLHGVRFLPIENSATEEAAFRSGQMHKTESVPLTKLPVYRRESPDLLKISPYSGVYYFSFNTKKPPFTDVRIRQALAMAVDRESIVRNITLGGEQPAYHFTPDGLAGYTSLAHTRLDFDAARRLLAEAGYPGGRGLPPINLLYNTADNHRIICEAIQQTWKRELGIEVRLENEEWKVYLDSMDNGDYQICRAGLIVEPFDPSLFLRVFIGDNGYNRTGWSDPEYDRLYREVIATTDQDRRVALMQRMEQILTDAMPILPIYYYTQHYLMRPSVHGWTDNLLSQPAFDQAWLE